MRLVAVLSRPIFSANTDELIEIMRESGRDQTRAKLFAGYAATFEAAGADRNRADVAATPADSSVQCGDCAEAVLDAAGG